ncbi:MAG: hypothetical protein HY347_09130 [candidate division NC10 bacterium]|nr:hypothetical protein [candidate division NC10 bacterium]
MSKVWRRRSYQLDEAVIRELNEFCFATKQRPSHVIEEALKVFFRQVMKDKLATLPVKERKRLGA